MFDKDDYFMYQEAIEATEQMEKLGLAERWNYLLFQVNDIFNRRFSNSDVRVMWDTLDANGLTLAIDHSYHHHDRSFRVILSVFKGDAQTETTYLVHETLNLKELTLECFKPHLEYALGVFSTHLS